MKFSDYFSNNFETKEDHMYETLRTHYYRARLEEAKKEVLDLIEREKGKIIDDNENSSKEIYDENVFEENIFNENQVSQKESDVSLDKATPDYSSVYKKYEEERSQNSEIFKDSHGKSNNDDDVTDDQFFDDFFDDGE